MKVMQFERLISSDLYVEGPTPARYWGDQWLRVAEKLLKGLNNQFTDQVASIDATVASLSQGSATTQAVAHRMQGEVGRLNELLILYRSITAEPVAAPEPTRFQDILGQAVRLHQHHVDLRHIPCQISGTDDMEPVLVRPSALLRCMLVLLGSVAGNVLRSGRESTVLLEYGTDDGDVCLRMSGAAPNGQLLFSGEGSLLHAVRAALAHAHAAADGSIIRGGDDQIEYYLRMPSLSKMRSSPEL
jgi:hypothetical protein